MASLVEYADGLKRVEFSLASNGQRQYVRLGRMDKRTAEAVTARLEQVIAAKAAGVAIDAETARWMASLDDKLYGRLVAAGLADARTKVVGFTLRQLLDRFAANMDAKDGTVVAYGHVLRNLADYFTDTKPLASITPADADGFKTWLKVDQHLSSATTNRRTIAARTIFRRGVRWEMVSRNVFEGVKAGGQANELRKQFIPQADVAKVLAACPDSQWRTLVALSRFGGLRVPSEALPLTWQDVNWEANTLLVHSPKTAHHEGQASRTIPLFPELRQVLLEAFEQAAAGSTHIITMADSAQVNWRTNLERIIRRAGLTPWPKPWHNMRASRQSELMAEYSLPVACKWLGNSPAVAAKHYAMAVNLDADFNRATGQKAGAVKGAVKSAAVSSSNDVQGCAGELANRENIRELHNTAHAGDAMQSRILGDTGYEHYTKTPVKTHVSEQGAVKGAAFEPYYTEDFAFVKVSWDKLPAEIKAVIVATVRRGLSR